MKAQKRTFVLLVVAMILGYLPWYNFSAVLPYLAHEFDLTSSQTGYILSAFQAGYVVVVLITGKLADVIGPKKVAAWATLLTAVSATLFVWLAQGFTSILVLRLLTGLSAGAIYVPGMAILANWFPPGRRGRVIGGYTAALTLAYAGGYFVAAPLASTYGWKTGMMATSLPAFLAAWVMFALVEEKPSADQQIELGWGLDVGSAHKQDSQNKHTVSNATKVKPAPEGGYKGPGIITLGYMGHMWELYAFWGWIGPFMVASALATGMTQMEAVAIGGRLAAMIIMLGAPAVYLCGIVADKIGRIKTITVCAIFSLAGQFVLGNLYGKPLSLVTMVGLWIGFWVVADSGIFKAGLTEMTDVSIRATALGVQSAFGYFMTILSPTIFGKLLEVINPGLGDPTMAIHWGLPFAMLGAGALLVPIAMMLLNRLPQALLMAEGKK